jgi:hypothetical protein
MLLRLLLVGTVSTLQVELEITTSVSTEYKLDIAYDVRITCIVRVLHLHLQVCGRAEAQRAQRSR